MTEHKSSIITNHTMTSVSSLIEKAANYIANLMKQELSPALTFHNLSHTREVVAAAHKIAQYEELTPDQVEIIVLAAWFHDIGQITCYRGHELSSQQIAYRFLSENNCSEAMIEQILACINATRMPQNPRNQLEGIMCDSDLSHLAAPPLIYMEHLKRLRDEWEKVLGKNEKEADWILLNIDFLNQHHYFSNYGKDVLESEKEKNINFLMELL